jgi:TrmH family RNA methyltransferase
MATARITSRRNALVARCRALADGSDRTAMLLDGGRLIDEALAARIVIDQLIVQTGARERGAIGRVVAEAEHQRVPVVEVSAPVLAAVSPVRSPSGVVAVARRPVADAGRVFVDAGRSAVIACDVQDPGNVGAIVRAAEAAGASGVVAAGASADPFGWKALRGSMGSAFRLPVAAHMSAVDATVEAHRRGYRLIAAVPRGGVSLFDVDLSGRVAFAIGAEGAGLTAELLAAADERITIPMDGPVESLNAAVTAALLLYEARRQRKTS